MALSKFTSNLLLEAQFYKHICCQSKVLFFGVKSNIPSQLISLRTTPYSSYPFWKLNHTFPIKNTTYQSKGIGEGFLQKPLLSNSRIFHMKSWDHQEAQRNLRDPISIENETMKCEKSGSSSSTSSKDVSSTLTNPEQPLSKRAKLKQAIKDYGSTVLVFHISMSLCSLGMFYLLVSSGLDVVALLEKMGVGEKILASKITAGASTFVIAYAVHKVFAPLRITITLTATPLIVKKLRALGILKKVSQ